MTKILKLFAFGLIIGALCEQAIAVTPPQLAAIRALGELNGVALQCRYFEQTQKMKKALIAALPKRRQLGQTFDDATNQAFLHFIEQKQTCPAPQEFNRQVVEEIEHLYTMFPK